LTSAPVFTGRLEVRMRRVLLSLALAAAASPLDAQSFDKVTDGVWAAIPKPGVPVGSNGAFIVNDDDVLVVDTHYRPSYARELMGEIKKVTPLAVRYVVNTHWHNDHTQGNQALHQRLAARRRVPLARRRARGHRGQAADCKAYLAELKQVEITLPTLTFARRVPFRVGRHAGPGREARRPEDRARPRRGPRSHRFPPQASGSRDPSRDGVHAA